MRWIVRFRKYNYYYYYYYYYHIFVISAEFAITYSWIQYELL